MIISVGAPAAPPPVRPATVRAAVVVQIGAAALLLAGAVVAAVAAVLQNAAITEAARTVAADPMIVEEERFGNAFTAVVPGGICVVLALWFGGLTIGLWRGANVARILTMVGAGVPVLCGLCQCAGGLAMGALLVGLPEGPPPSEFDPEIPAEPGLDRYDVFYAELDRVSTTVVWMPVVASLLAFLIFAAILAVVILLVMPSAHRYFRPDGGRPDIRYVPVPYPVYYWPGPPPGAPGG